MLKIAKRNVQGYQRETVPFLGLNRGDDVKEGEFSAQTNMSARRYPFLAPRLSRAKEAAMEGTDALFYWDGHEVVAANGALYLDGEVLCNVTIGPKQFAVVNTALVVWPDKVSVDLTEKKAGNLSAEGIGYSSTSFTTNSVTLATENTYATYSTRYRGGDAQRPYIWTYASASWTSEGGWVLTDGKWTMAGDSSVGRYFVPAVTWSDKTNRYTASSPESQFTANNPTGAGTPGNNVGIYGRVDKVEDFYMTAMSFQSVLLFSVFNASQMNASMSELFKVGDAVTITGTPLGVHDIERRLIKEINPNTNTLTFTDGTFLSGDAAGIASMNYTKESVTAIWSDGSSISRYRSTSVTAEKGHLLIVDRSAKVLRVYDDKKVLLKEYAAESVSNDGTVPIQMTYIKQTDEPVTIKREVPDIDYICSHENRLWGVSNKDRTIYSSALGDPANFFVYDGLSTDSYAVAVGSEGAFTGICSFGGAVLCWKERSLHKVLGNLPENYQTAEYSFSGVRDGAHKSLVNINEMLFYLGVDGVYSYTGNRPTLISKPLGYAILRKGVGGTDGRTYYLSAQNGEKWELLSFDTHSGLWNRSDETQVIDFGRTENVVKFLSGEHLYTIGAGDEAVEWETVFVPVYETLDASKQYRRLIFRAEVPKGSWLAADVRYDDGRWMQVGIVKGNTGPVRMPVPIRRCDKFQIRLRGVGDCAVLDMAREFRLRGDR